jgi:hypothetical protein
MTTEPLTAADLGPPDTDVPMTPEQMAAAFQTMQQASKLGEEAAWVRKKLGLPEDTPFVSGNGPTLAGMMHVVCSHAHGYETYIKAYKCDDKQGEIARLTVEVAALREERDRLVKTLTDIAFTALKASEIPCQVEEGPNDQP